jgi:hypothetical protein
VRAMVLGATTLPVSVVMTIVTAAGYNHPTVVAAVVNAVGAYIDNLGLEQPLPFTRLESVAYNASPGITNVTNVTLNSGTADITPGAGQTIKVNSLIVS